MNGVGRWSDDRVAWLRRLVRQGLTDDEIAARMAISAHAVIGKRFRLKLAGNRKRAPRHLSNSLPPTEQRNEVAL